MVTNGFVLDMSKTSLRHVLDKSVDGQSSVVGASGYENGGLNVG